MALSNILSAIDSKTDEDIAKITKQGQEKASTVKAEFDKKLHDKKEDILKKLKATADRKVSQASFQVQSQVNGKILKKKREVIDQVFQKSLEKLSSLNEADAKKILVKLIKSLPEVTDGKIIPVVDSESAVKSAAKEADTKYEISSKAIKGKGGFIFQSAGLTIDNTWEQLIARQQDLLETEVANILFYG